LNEPLITVWLSMTANWFGWESKPLLQLGFVAVICGYEPFVEPVRLMRLRWDARRATNG